MDSRIADTFTDSRADDGGSPMNRSGLGRHDRQPHTDSVKHRE